MRPDIVGGHDSLKTREERSRKLINVQITTESGVKFSANVTNISKYGMGAKSAGTVRESEQVQVFKDGFGCVQGEVRWVDGQNFGLKFHEPIDIDRFNFSHQNGKGHFVRKIENGHVWKGFEVKSSTRRPGVTSQFSNSDSKDKEN